MLISSFLQPFTGDPGQDVSCELKQRYFSLTLRHGKAVFWEMDIMYTLSYRQHSFSD